MQASDSSDSAQARRLPRWALATAIAVGGGLLVWLHVVVLMAS